MNSSQEIYTYGLAGSIPSTFVLRNGLRKGAYLAEDAANGHSSKSKKYVYRILRQVRRFELISFLLSGFGLKALGAGVSENHPAPDIIPVYENSGFADQLAIQSGSRFDRTDFPVTKISLKTNGWKQSPRSPLGPVRGNHDAFYLSKAASQWLHAIAVGVISVIAGLLLMIVCGARMAAFAAS